MNSVVVDASVAIKWVVDEDGTQGALAVLQQFGLLSPDLIFAECANILWKKVRLSEITQDEAIEAASLIRIAKIEVLPVRCLVESALRLAIELDHAAYDCVYLALALQNDCPFVTADQRLRRKVAQSGDPRFTGRILSIDEASMPT